MTFLLQLHNYTVYFLLHLIMKGIEKKAIAVRWLPYKCNSLISAKKICNWRCVA